LDSVVALGAGVYAINFIDSGNAIIGVGNNLNRITILTSGSGINGNGKEVGIFGYSNSTDEASFGIIGRTPDTAGIGVVGSDDDLVPPGTLTRGGGMMGYSDNVGVFGRGDTSNSSYGVYGISDDSTGGYGLVGSANIGIFGRGSSLRAANTGVYGYAVNYSSGVDAGVFGGCQDTNADFAGYFQGDIRVTKSLYTKNYYATGTKSALLKTDDGYRAVYCQESPEIWFEDFGSGQLENGRVLISLPQDFLGITTIDEKNPMKVYVQLTDPNCNGVAVIKKNGGFEVVELANGKSNATFDWRVVAKRKGYENKRFDFVTNEIMEFKPITNQPEKEFQPNKIGEAVSMPSPKGEKKMDRTILKNNTGGNQ
jgi:hypothetical protein